MDSYYSSDEEIAWGPPTSREIKSYLKKRVVKKSNRRHTVLCKIQNTQMDQSLSKEVNHLNTSGTSTAYYSPNESLKTESNVDFLEKLSHVINNPSLESSEYASVLEHTENCDNQLEDTNKSQIEPPIIPEIVVTKEVEPWEDDTCTDFIRAIEKRETNYNIENFHQTLVENSYVVSENEQTTEETETSELNKHTVSPENKCVTEEEEVILLSDDSSSAENCEDVSIDNRNHEDVSYDTEDKDELDKSDLERDIKKHQFEVENQSNAGNRVYDVNNFEELIVHQLDNENNLVTPNAQKKLSVIKECLSTSPVIVPEIDLTQFDDSTKDDSLQLNDTLEEMNRLLTQGLNYSMSDDEDIINTPIMKDTRPQEILTPCNKISSNKQLFSNGKDKTSHIPKRKFIPTSAEKKTNTFTISKASPKSNFKVPDIPSRSKLTNPTPPKSSPNLANIVSPVALYIKNSPRIPLRQNIPLRELQRVDTASSKSANKENYVEFPEILYKPSKEQITSTEKHIVVPPYMRKLNIKEAQITKHEGRINCESKKSKVSRKLLESDITSTTIDTDHSLVDYAGDVSVLTNRQAFIK